MRYRHRLAVVTDALADDGDYSPAGNDAICMRQHSRFRDALRVATAREIDGAGADRSSHALPGGVTQDVSGTGRIKRCRHFIRKE